MSEGDLTIREHQVEVRRTRAGRVVSSAQMRHDPPVMAVEERITREVRKAAAAERITLVGEPFVVWRAEVVWSGVKQPEGMTDDEWFDVIERYEDVIVEAIDRG